MDNKTVKKTIADFKTRYTEVSDKVKKIKAQLKEAFKDARTLAKDASKLYHFGECKLYDDNPAFASLPDKMDKLSSFSDIQFDIERIIENIDEMLI